MKDPGNNYLRSSQSYLDDMLDMTKDEFDVPSGESAVAEFYADRNVLITGASGFMGILLIEKLLRSCPKLGKIYMLIRAKKGKRPEERLKEQFNNEIYERLKSEQPDFLSHVVPIEGDTSKIDLGLSAEDRETLIESTHVVFHGAASVRFDAALREAININVRGTKLLIQLARKMKKLKTFVHISTAFSHCPLHHIEEKFYASPIDPEKMITLVELMNDEMLAHMQPK